VTNIVNARTQHDLIRTISFLTGLNDSFNLVGSHILLMDPLPPINKVLSMNSLQFTLFIAILKHELDRWWRWQCDVVVVGTNEAWWW
jgi:hypothetical protein